MFVGQLQRRTDLVALVPVGAVFLARSLDGGQRYKAAWLVDIERLSSSTLAVHHEVAIPQVVGAAEGIAFGDTSAQGVVGIARGLGDAMARGVRFDELVVCVPGQVQHFLGAGLLVAPGALCDVAVHVVFKVQVLVEAQAVVAHHAKSGVHGLAVFAGDGVQQVACGVEGKQFAGQRAALCREAGEDAARGVVAEVLAAAQGVGSGDELTCGVVGVATPRCRASRSMSAMTWWAAGGWSGPCAAAMLIWCRWPEP